MPAGYLLSTSHPAIGATKPTATGHGVINRPVSTADRPRTSSKKKGSETKARFWAVNEQTDVATDSAKTGRANSSTASIGYGKSSWRQTKRVPVTAAAASSSATKIESRRKLSIPVISIPNVTALS